MSTINKVPASAGAEWLLGAFALLRKAPLALGVLGLIWGLLSILAVQVMALNVSLGLFVQLALALLGPLLFAGLLWAVREVDEGRVATPAHLFHAVRGEHALSLLATLLPQLAAALVLGFLLIAMIGPTELQHLAEVVAKLQETAQSGGQPDPELVRSLPVGRLLLWVLMLFAAVIAMSLVTFVAVPDIVFGGNGGFAAMRNSFRACLHNLLAMLVFYVLLFIALFALSIGIQLLAMVVQLVAGPTAGMWVSNLLLMAVLMPLMAGAVFYAWRQMLGGVAAPVAQTHLEA
ncbi:MAG TPA: BPSS1780 family membrane protein [Pseudoxanthomonas sp.]|nr:BPSS1780 family membrane protein [Pseudoxanthomonas sp.]